MRHDGKQPFDRPMRPSRIQLIKEAAEGLAADPKGVEVLKQSESYAAYQAWVTWSMFQALSALWPDTMISEIEAGLSEAEPVSRRAFEAARLKGPKLR